MKPFRLSHVYYPFVSMLGHIDGIVGQRHIQRTSFICDDTLIIKQQKKKEYGEEKEKGAFGGWVHVKLLGNEDITQADATVYAYATCKNPG